MIQVNHWDECIFKSNERAEPIDTAVAYTIAFTQLTLLMIASPSDNKHVVTVINKSSLLLVAIVEGSELYTSPIRQTIIDNSVWSSSRLAVSLSRCFSGYIDCARDSKPLSDYVLLAVTVINKSNLIVAAIVEGSELYTLPISHIMPHRHHYDIHDFAFSGQPVGEFAGRT